MAFTEYKYNYNFAVRENGKQVKVTNSLGRTALYGEIVYLNGFLGVVEEFAGIANSASGRIALLEPGMKVTTSQILTTDTFTVGNKLYFTPGGSSAAGKLVSAPAANSVLVGTITAEEGTGGAQTSVEFTPEGVSSIAPKAVKVERVVIDAATDYSTTGKSTSIPLGSTILDVVAIATATASGGTAQVFNGASAVHTALVMATDQAVTRMAAGVDDTKLTVTGAVTVKTHASGDAGIVEIFYL